MINEAHTWTAAFLYLKDKCILWPITSPVCNHPHRSISEITCARNGKQKFVIKARPFIRILRVKSVSKYFSKSLAFVGIIHAFKITIVDWNGSPNFNVVCFNVKVVEITTLKVKAAAVWYIIRIYCVQRAVPAFCLPNKTKNVVSISSYVTKILPKD